MGMSTDETVPSAESTDLFRKTSPKTYAIYRWLFIIGLVTMILRILGIGGESDIAQVVNAAKVGNFVTVIVDILADAAFIATLFYALLRPRREVFIVGATMVFFFFWMNVMLTVTGIFKANIADELSFMLGANRLNDLSGVVASIFPLFGFLTVPPGEGRTAAPQRKEQKIVAIAVPVIAGALLAILPMMYFTGSASSGPTTLSGIGAKLFLAWGIVAASIGLFRKANSNLFWGVMMSMWLLEAWQGVTRLSGTPPSYWPGLGLIMGIVACLLLLFSEPVTRWATRLLFARRPVITESE